MLFALLISACRQSEQAAAVQDPPAPAPSSTPTILPTHTPDASPSLEPTQTATPSITPTDFPTATPTATAVPVSISGDPRSQVVSTPAPDGNAPCGVVDLFDFPLDPPHGQDAVGGHDFGTWRGRFEKYHAGEDWRMASGQNLGRPVYSIGHGLVTYAEPEGWGRDKGVVIIRHTFTDGSSILSFYGHLDPPSVTLKPGLCVTRGEEIGQIGQPRSRPHLHFEIRSHLPYQTATGYWDEDPREAGWLPPSQTIWQTRMSVIPGVDWTYSPAADRAKIVGITPGNTVILNSNDEIFGLDPTSGNVIWSAVLPEEHEVAALDESGHLIYTATQLGTISAHQLPDTLNEGATTSEPPELDSLWSIDVDLLGLPLFLPLPQTGLAAVYREKMMAVTPHGNIAWQVDDVSRPLDWLTIDERLLLSSEDPEKSLLSIDLDAAVIWPKQPGGQLAMNDGNIWLYNNEGVFRLDPLTLSADHVVDLSGRNFGQTDLLAMPDGNILITHQDSQDRRLIQLDDQGQILWQRSIAAVAKDETRLVERFGKAYLIARNVLGDVVNFELYAIDQGKGDLAHIFNGGSRSPSAGAFELLTLGDDQILISIDGQNIVAFDPQAAEVGN